MPRIRLSRSGIRLTSTALAGWLVLSISLASACTIPVFRYALERWDSDRFLVIVYHDGRLTADQTSALKELAQQSSLAGGPLNIEVIRYDLTSPSPPKLADVQPPSADRPLPWVEVRARVAATRTVVRWQGSLAEASELPGLFDSPARSEIVRRILAGHSSVWLLVAPEEQAPRLGEQLQAALDGVTRELALPPGIGLPGSELHTSIPLEIRYSVLPISHTDPKEQQFLKWLAASTADWRTDTAYIVPVFGRCRALDVFPYAEADAPLIQDVAEFICGACSCQVKQANPGFDLLASVNWDQRLFDSSIPQQRDGEFQATLPGASELPSSPQYLAVPPGNRDVGKAERKSTAEQTKEADDEFVGKPVLSHAHIDDKANRQMPRTIQILLLLGALALVSGAVLSGAVLIRR